MTSPVVIGVCKKNLSPSYGEIPLVPKFSTTPSEAALLASKPWGNRYEAPDNESDVLIVNVVTPTFSLTT